MGTAPIIDCSSIFGAVMQKYHNILSWYEMTTDWRPVHFFPWSALVNFENQFDYVDCQAGHLMINREVQMHTPTIPTACIRIFILQLIFRTKM